jgi:hypothetical protein
MAGIVAGAGNEVLVQHQLENNDPTNWVQKEECILLTDSCMHKMQNLWKLMNRLCSWMVQMHCVSRKCRNGAVMLQMGGCH